MLRTSAQATLADTETEAKRKLSFRIVQAFLFLALAVVLFSLFTKNLEEPALYHVDENLWVYAGNKAFQTFFIDHNVTDPFWKDDLYYYGAYQPQIGKYIIGAGTYIAGYRDLPMVRYDFSKDMEGNKQHGNLLPTDLLIAARMPIAVTGAVSCLALFLIVSQTLNIWCGFIAVLCIYNAQILRLSSQRAMIDVPMVCFSLFAILALIYFSRAIAQDQSRRAIISSVLVGIFCGLAIATKLSGGVVAIICAIVWAQTFVYCWFKSQQQLRLLLLCGFSMFACAIVIVIGSNPFLYGDPIGGIRHMLSFSNILETSTTGTLTPTLDAKLLAVWNQILGHAPLHQRGLPGDRWLLLLGCIGLIATVFQNRGLFVRRSLHIVLTWIIITYVIITLWLPINISRYMLPLQACNAFIVAYGIGFLAHCAFLLLRRSKMLNWSPS